MANAIDSRYRIVQQGVHAFMIQRRIFGLVWIDSLEFSQYSQEDCLKILETWAADRAVDGRIVWP